MICRALVGVMALACTACLPQKELRLAGKTMGTAYHIKVVAGWMTSGADLQAKIDERLAVINGSMSTYDPASEISRFNALASTGESLSVSDDFNNVLQVAAELHRLTEGAWDGTLDPLINLWGFGRQGPAKGIPEEAEIRQALARVGFDRIRMDPQGAIGKHNPEVTLDLASIAKGYGVDEIARLLGANGVVNFPSLRRPRAYTSPPISTRKLTNPLSPRSRAISSTPYPLAMEAKSSVNSGLCLPMAP